MIKRIGCAIKHPTNRSQNTAPTSPKLAGIVPETSKDTYTWYVETRRYGSLEEMTLQQTVMADDRQLFDRSTEWPTDHRRSNVTAREKAILESETNASMVKAVFMVARRPGLTVAEFQEYSAGEHGGLISRVPGLRRYVQNHAVVEAYGQVSRPMTHDGFSELWFDDLAGLQVAWQSAEWQTARSAAERPFAQPVGLVIGRERIQKELPPEYR